MIKLMSLMLLVFGVTSAWGQSISATSHYKEELESLLKEVKSKLPAKILESIGQVQIESKLIGKSFLASEKYFCPDDNDDLQYAYVAHKSKKSTLVVDDNLLELLRRSEAGSISVDIKCPHKTIRQFALATMAHELTHVFDLKDKLSFSKDYLRLVGGRMSWWKNKGRGVLMNQNAASSPDTYEYENLREHLAVNMEYFLFDEDYKCRRPAMYNYLSRQFNVDPSGRDCSGQHKILLHSNITEENLTILADIDPKRVYKVHYFWAGEGKAMMSKWGHAMFRLVICAPWRKEVGPDCMNDVLDHLVLSYRAHFASVDSNLMQGMVGKLPSQLFIYRLSDILQEYNKFEFRDIYSVPLNFSRDEIESFVDLSIDRYWNYKSKYIFFTNNCGTEALRQLRVVSENSNVEKVHSATPRKMYKDLLKEDLGLAEINIKKKSRDELIDMGLLYPTKYDLYQRIYEEVKKEAGGKHKNITKLVKKSSALERRAMYQKAIDKNKGMAKTKKASVINKIMLLEIYVRDAMMMKLPEKMLKASKQKDLKADVDRLKGKTSHLFATQWDLVDTKYGIPSAEEMSAALENKKIDLKASQDEFNSEMLEILKKLQNSKYAKDIKEITDSEGTIQFLKKLKIDLNFYNFNNL
jgi:hypothetical protein